MLASFCSAIGCATITTIYQQVGTISCSR